MITLMGCLLLGGFVVTCTAFGPESFRFIRDEFRNSSPVAIRRWWIHEGKKALLHTSILIVCLIALVRLAYWISIHTSPLIP